ANHSDCFARRRRYACCFRCDGAGFAWRRNLRNRYRLIRKVDVTYTPKSSADPYHDEQNRNYDEDQTTFCKTARAAFWRRLNLGVHFRDSIRILACAPISSIAGHLSSLHDHVVLTRQLSVAL